MGVSFDFQHPSFSLELCVTLGTSIQGVLQKHLLVEDLGAWGNSRGSWALPTSTFVAGNLWESGLYGGGGGKGPDCHPNLTVS